MTRILFLAFAIAVLGLTYAFAEKGAMVSMVLLLGTAYLFVDMNRGSAAQAKEQRHSEREFTDLRRAA
jgi:hypothetical protein